MIVLVCGGRDYSDNEKVFNTLFKIHFDRKIDLVIQGGATGADNFAKQWANHIGIHNAEIKAIWGFHGRSAGPKRNYAMSLLNIDLLVAFPGGNGTKNMIKICEENNVEIIRIINKS